MSQKAISDIITDAIVEGGVDRTEARREARRIIKRLGEDKPCIASWVAEMGVFRFIGFVRRDNPKRVQEVAGDRGYVAAYIANGSE